MRKSSKTAIIVMTALFILVFAAAVPYIVFPTNRAPEYVMFQELSSVRTWLDKNAENVLDVGKDVYLGDTETTDSVNVTFTYEGREYRLSAHVFATKETLRDYFAARTGYGTELDKAANFRAYYFSTALTAFENNSIFSLSGGDYLAFTRLVGELFGAQTGAGEAAHVQV
ncbi:MAG: hypothetical protein DBX59_02810 [Bacillota bacterium]|nr:MAG: hypothetical protein DBX59_02810 [Bacillota bacterium]